LALIDTLQEDENLDESSDFDIENNDFK